MRVLHAVATSELIVNGTTQPHFGLRLLLWLCYYLSAGWAISTSKSAYRVNCFNTQPPNYLFNMSKMSEDNEADTTTSCCASCGIAEVDDIKLKECDGCDLVRYCSDECQRNHKLEHEEACKQRAAEYVMNYYSSNQRAAILETARSAVYLCRLMI